MNHNTLDNNILQLMTDREQKKMLDIGRNIQLSKRQILFHYGDSATAFYLIKSGKIKLFRISSAGREKVFGIHEKGDSMGVMLMFIPNSRYPMTAQAEQDCELIKINKEILIDLTTHSPQLAERLLGCIGGHMLHLINTIDKLSHPDAGQRLVIHFAELYQTQKNSELFIALTDTKSVLASQLGMQPETLSRLFRKFKKESLLLEKNHKVYFPDIEKLCDSVDLTSDIFQHKN